MVSTVLEKDTDASKLTAENPQNNHSIEGI